MIIRCCCCCLCCDMQLDALTAAHHSNCLASLPVMFQLKLQKGYFLLEKFQHSREKFTYATDRLFRFGCPVAVRQRRSASGRETHLHVHLQHQPTNQTASKRSLFPAFRLGSARTPQMMIDSRGRKRIYFSRVSLSSKLVARRRCGAKRLRVAAAGPAKLNCFSFAHLHFALDFHPSPVHSSQLRSQRRRRSLSSNYLVALSRHTTK